MLINANSKAAHHYISMSSMLHQLRTFMMTGARSYTANNRAIRCKNTKKKEMQKVIFCLRYLDRDQQQEVREFRGVKGRECVAPTRSRNGKMSTSRSISENSCSPPPSLFPTPASSEERSPVSTSLMLISLTSTTLNSCKQPSNSESDEFSTSRQNYFEQRNKSRYIATQVKYRANKILR